MSYITVVTPTFNRAHTLHRVFESLVAQDFNDFEWLIIDDGSTDNTKEIVNEFILKANFSVRYYYKSNGGRHTALNYSYNLINSEYVINIDSDDELTNNALSNIKKAWESIPNEDYNRFWLVCGKCIDSQTNSIIGDFYDENLNKLKGIKQHKATLKYKGEKACCRKLSILKEFPFPEYEDTKFVLENTVWEKINKEYDQFFINDALRVYHTDSEDSLSKGAIHSSSLLKTKKNSYLFYLNECFNQLFYNKRVLFSIINYSYNSLLLDEKLFVNLGLINKVYKKIIIILFFPFSYLRYISR